MNYNDNVLTITTFVLPPDWTEFGRSWCLCCCEGMCALPNPQPIPPSKLLLALFIFLRDGEQNGAILPKLEKIPRSQYYVLVLEEPELQIKAVLGSAV